MKNFLITEIDHSSAADSPAVTVLHDGRFVVAWHSNKTGDFDSYGSIYNSDGSIDIPEFKINSTTSSSQIMPKLSPLSDGGFVATWRDKGTDGDSFGTFSQIFSSDGAKVYQEFQVNTVTYGNQFNPSIATLNDGNFVISWWDGSADGDEYGMYAQIFSTQGEKIGSDIQLNTFTDGQQARGSIVATDDGGFFCGLG